MAEPLLTTVDAQLSSIAAERDRIAGELHDDSVQAMTAVSLQLQRLKSRATAADDVALIDHARRTTDEAIERLRHMLFVLHPSSLETDGLVVTMEIYLESFVESDGISWQVDGDADLELPVGVAALGFRLARESVSNAVRHGAPTHITVTVTVEESTLVILVRDDGSGFDAGQREFRVGHLGLRHSASLAEAARGSYSVHSALGDGTTVEIRLPIGTT